MHLHLPIYVMARRPRFRVTYTCPTDHWAGQKLRDFRGDAYDEVEARDGRQIMIGKSDIARLVALPPPNSIMVADAT